MASTANPVAPRIKVGCRPAARWPRNFVPAAPSPFAQRRRAHRSLSSRTLYLERRSLQRPLAYGKQVQFLNSLPAVFLLELFFIWIPILYHGLYGVYIWYQGDTNVAEYPWTGNWLYTSQRWTGIIAFVYMVQHTYFLRFTGVHLPTHPMQSFAKVQTEFQNPVDDRFLCGRHHCRFLALQLRTVAVRGEVGHHHWRTRRAAALATSACCSPSCWFRLAGSACMAS